MKNDIETELAQLREENKCLRKAAQRPAKLDEEHARAAWSLATQLLKQAQAENELCAYWFVSAISKLSNSHPRRPVIEVLALARQAMPTAAQQYADYVADRK